MNALVERTITTASASRSISSRLVAVSLVFVTAALACATAAVAQSPAPATSTKAVKRYTPEQFLATTSMNGASFSADEKRILFSSNETGVFHSSHRRKGRSVDTFHHRFNLCGVVFSE
jgi:hypothetical protein